MLSTFMWRARISVVYLLVPSLAAAEAPREDWARYSNVCVSPATGDTRGAELLFERVQGSFQMRFRDATGEPHDPLPTALELIGDNLKFDVQRNGRRATFAGTITPQEVSGVLSLGAEDKFPETLHLQRRPTEFHGYPDCK
ncbi:MAG TPA: hypothetical protein VMI56_09600 [Reyranella sp.]|nr:hypothetical protein [Reyranella sp.]